MSGQSPPARSRWRRRLARQGAVVLALVVLDALRIAACAPPSREDAEARLAYLARRIDERSLPGLAPSAPFDGEWQLVTLSMSVAAATNLAFRYPESREARRAQVAAWTSRMLEPAARDFDTRQWSQHDALASLHGDEGHAGYYGHLLLALGAACLLGEPVQPALHGQLADAVAARLDAASGALIETYPGEVYVPDNVVVVAGLSLFDRCHGTTGHRATVERWLETMTRTRLDATTGVLTFAPGQLGRGSGAAWNAFFLPFIDEPLAREQRAALWSAFEARPPFAVALREWPRGVDGPGDVDSGPLVFGLSASATGFGMAAAAQVDDEERLRGMLVTAEAAGFTVGLGERRYLLAPLVGDAIVLAARTATPWDRRFLAPR